MKQRLQVLIETPKGSREKYNFDPDTKEFVFGKLLPLGMCFPFDFGLIPGTKGEDGDPLDAMLIAEFNTFPGCKIDARLIGMLEAEQEEGGKLIKNDRYFFVPESSLVYEHVANISDISDRLVEQLLNFFVVYNKEEGRKFKPLAVRGAAEAASKLSSLMQQG